MAENSSPKIYGLIGYPVRHSFSPAMHNAAFKHLGINAEYRLFEVKPEELEDFLLKPDKVFKDTNGNSIRAGDVLGFNITIPHKVRAIEILGGPAGFIKDIHTERDHYVFLSGAINTIKRESGKWYYCNTDANGFLKSLKEDLGFDTKGKSVLLIGCGGAGRAVVASLTWGDAGIVRIYIFDTNREVVESTQKHFSRFSLLDLTKRKLRFITAEQIPDKIKECSLIVNASPVGMKDSDDSVIDKGLLHNKLSVYDVVYNRETQLIKDAKSKRLPAKGGEGMLLYQGAAAFEFWTGKRAPVDIMRRALEEELKKCPK